MTDFIQALTKTKEQLVERFISEEDKRHLMDMHNAHWKLDLIARDLETVKQTKEEALKAGDQEAYRKAVDLEDELYNNEAFFTSVSDEIDASYEDDAVIQEFNKIAKSFDMEMRVLLKDYRKRKEALADKFIEIIQAQDLFLEIRRLYSDCMEPIPENLDDQMEYGGEMTYGKRFMKTVEFSGDAKAADAFFEDELKENRLEADSGERVLDKKEPGSGKKIFVRIPNKFFNEMGF